MDPNNPNPGSFAAPIGGGGSAISQALSARGMDPNILNQISPSAPTAPARGVPQSAPQGAPSVAPQPQPAQNAIGTPPTPAESQIIVKALDSRLKKLGELQSMGIQV